MIAEAKSMVQKARWWVNNGWHKWLVATLTLIITAWAGWITLDHIRLSGEFRDLNSEYHSKHEGLVENVVILRQGMIRMEDKLDLIREDQVRFYQQEETRFGKKSAWEKRSIKDMK